MDGRSGKKVSLSVVHSFGFELLTVGRDSYQKDVRCREVSGEKQRGPLLCKIPLSLLLYQTLHLL